MTMRLIPLIPLTALVFAAAAFGQVAPLKPGLWQVRAEGNGASTANLGDRLKNVPPERRAQVEAMLKQRGVDISGGDLKICLDQKSVDQGAWQQKSSDANCKLDYSSRTSSRWAWTTVCTTPALTSETEVLFNGPEAYRITSTTTTTQDGQPKVTRVAMNSTWLGADCGDIKPVGRH